MGEHSGGSEQHNWAYWIRLRPGILLGDLGPAGLHRLADELVEYNLAEFSSGHGKGIRVRIGSDGSLSVADDARGIPVDRHANADLTTLEWVMTCSTGVEVHGGERVFRTSHHGVGARAVTALSDWAEAEVCRDGRVYRQRYERGLPAGNVCDIGPAGGQSGTKVTFKPDPEIFHDATFDYDTLEARLRELALLNKGMTVSLHDERRTDKKEVVFKFDGGLVEFVKHINTSLGEAPLHAPISIEKTANGVAVEIAMQYTKSEEERVRCYTNNAFNSLGGTHLVGFRTALTCTLNAYGTGAGLFENVSPIGEDFREGLTVILSVQVSEPQFESQAKMRLNNPEVKGIVTSIVNEALAKYLEEHPEEARRIVLKALAAAQGRNASNPARPRKG